MGNEDYDKTDATFKQILDHLGGKRTLLEEYKLILKKESTLSATAREMVTTLVIHSDQSDYSIEDLLDKPLPLNKPSAH